MFTPSFSLDSSPAGDAFDELAHNSAVRRRAEIRELELIGEACDAWVVDEARADAACEKLVSGGAEGTALVGEFLALELAGILQMSPTTAALRIREVLDLRDRHPHLWSAMRSGVLPPWQAIKMAGQCASAGLSAAAAGWVDRQLGLVLPGLGWARVQRLVAGLIVKADPALAAERARQRHDDRYVHVGQHVDGGSELFARLDTEDALALDRTLRALADTLAEAGSIEGARQRRATALGILADPPTAAALLDHGARPTSPSSATCEVDASVHPPTETRGRACSHHRADGAADQHHLTKTDALTQATASGGRSRKHESPQTRGVAHPDDHRQARNATVYVHLSADMETGVARLEGVGPLDLETLRRFLTGCKVTVRPVIDLNAPPAVDRYEIPERLRTTVLLRNPVEAFPYSNRSSRGLDLDHTIPYDWDAPPGSHQTRADNLGPLSRRAHRPRPHGCGGCSRPILVCSVGPRRPATATR